MVRPFRLIFLFLVIAACAYQVMGAACSDDCLPRAEPFQAPGPGAQDGQTESDGSEGERALELALAQGDSLRVVQLTSACVHESTSYPQHVFLSDWFRPPALV